MSTLLLLIALALAAVLFAALVLWRGARYMGTRRSRFAHALLTMVLVVAGALAGAQLLRRVPLPPLDWHWIGLLLLGFGILCLLWMWLVSWLVLGAKPLQLVLAWAPALGASLVMWGLLIVVVRPFVLESHYLRSNSMAPTLLAMHHTGTCPHCGACAYVPFSMAAAFEEPGARRGMCSQCLRLASVTDMKPQVMLADRFMVNKLLTPRRWDLILYRDPRKFGNDVRFVKRLVGLPGEEIIIRDGGVWASGQRLEMPAELHGLEYSIQLFDGRTVHWGTEDHPARLGPNQYFVLDDFSVRSDDSRMWQNPSPDRPGFALPGANIEGVVAFIYWPPDRFRILR